MTEAEIAALNVLADASPVTVECAAAQFVGARRDLVARHLETLAIMGEVQERAGGMYAGAAVAA